MKKGDFSIEELERYSRHLLIPEFGEDGQRRLKEASVLVVGAGGLGCPALSYLTAAGTGHIGIVDDDVVERSNLQRQVLYDEEDIGKPKAARAAQKLAKLNPHVRFTAFEERLTSGNALKLMAEYDIVIDGTDNFPTRYLINDACVILGKPYVYGSIYRFEGQVSVFNYKFPDGTRGPQYRDLFPKPPPPGLVPNCAEGGVLGVLPGIIGSMQAGEAIKALAGTGEPLAGRMFIIDTLSFETRIIKLPKNHGMKPPEKLIDYEDFCGLKAGGQPSVREITAMALNEMMKKGQKFHLFDIREPHEHDLVNIGGAVIPPSQVARSTHLIPSGEPVILYCKTGVRSARAVVELQKAGFGNIFNLKGGIDRWAEEIDPSLPRY